MTSKSYASGSVYASVARYAGNATKARSGLIVRLADELLDWADRARSRRELRTLDDRALHDIGVSRYDAEREADKPFWRT